MSKFADYFASVLRGKIVAITSATPPHELTRTQIMLTSAEHKFLISVSSLEVAKQLIGSIEYKISQLEIPNDS